MIMLKDSVMEDVLKFLDHCEGQLIQLASSVTDLPLSPNSSWPHSPLCCEAAIGAEAYSCWEEHCHLRSATFEGSVFTYQKVDTDTIDCWQLYHFT